MTGQRVPGAEWSLNSTVNDFVTSMTQQRLSRTPHALAIEQV